MKFILRRNNISKSISSQNIRRTRRSLGVGWVVSFFISTFISKANIITDFKAVQAYKNKDFDKSKQIFENNVIQDPLNEEKLYNLANVFYQKKDYENAEKYYKKVSLSEEIDLKKKEEVFFNYGCTLAQQNKLEEALKSFEKVVQINKENKRAKDNIEKIKKLLEQKKQQEDKKNQEKNKENKEDKEKKDKNNKENSDKQKNDKSQQNSKNKDEKDKEQDDKNQQDKKNNEQEKNKSDKQNQDKNKQNKKDEEQKQNGQQNEEKNQNPEEQNEDFAGKDENLNNLDKKSKELLQAIENLDKDGNKRLIQAKLKQDSQNKNGQNNW